MEEKIHILYAEDNIRFTEDIQEFFPDEFVISIAENGKSAWEVFQQNPFDLILTDIAMPEMDGFELTKRIRTKNKTIPIVLLSSLIMQKEVIHGLECGADEFISKDTDPDVLAAKIKAILRRCTEYNLQLDPDNFFRISPLTTFNYATKTIRIGKKEWRITSMEAKLLELLAQRLNQCTTKEHLTETLWHDQGPDKNAYLDNYMVKIRKHLKHDPSIAIINTRGEGFCLTNQL